VLARVAVRHERCSALGTKLGHQLVRERVRLQNQLDSLLVETRIKLSRLISDLPGVSGRRILRAIADGETISERLDLLDKQIGKLDRITATALKWHQDGVILIAEIPDSAWTRRNSSSPKWESIPRPPVSGELHFPGRTVPRLRGKSGAKP
jgi:hypothetical protein